MHGVLPGAGTDLQEETGFVQHVLQNIQNRSLVPLAGFGTGFRGERSGHGSD